MNRTDRLHALCEELRRAGPHGRTAHRLAAWLEVSTRTVKRDVTALQQAGVPVWARSGPGGGYVLDRAATLPPVNLTAEQAMAVAVALASHPDAPFASAGRAALEKVLDVLDPAARARVESLSAAVWVRRAPGHPAGRARPSRARARAVVEEAIARRTVVVLDYRDREGHRTRRRVEPHVLARTGDRWYLIAWCRERQAPRWFRWDRIEGADATREVAPHRDPDVYGTPPDDASPLRAERPRLTAVR